MGRKRRHSHDRFLNVIHPDCAGIDIGSREHWVAVGADACEQPVQRFTSFTDDIERMGRWLLDCSVRVVAMEATGVYWIPVYEMLERMGLEVHLVNPRATRQISGRKSDVLDCQWLWQLMSYGLLRSAFRPAEDICELRAYVRQKKHLVEDRARTIAHMQKALTQMNLQLANVISDITGKTGMQILRAIVAGQRDPEVLAAFRDRRIKADEQTIARSLHGNWRDEHLLALTQALALYDAYGPLIDECEQCIVETGRRLAGDDTPAPAITKRCDTRMAAVAQQMLGVDLTAIPVIGAETALAVASEIGPDLSRFPSMAHFTSWLALAPPTRVSGGKPLYGKTRGHFNRVGQLLLTCAVNARRNDSYIGATHRARLGRMEKGKAVKATAHQLARIIYAMLTSGEGYVEKGVAHFEAQHRQRRLNALRRNARTLNMAVVELAA